MKRKKVYLTIFLILTLALFIPKNINASSAFRCFYSVTNDETDEKYTLKLLYAEGALKAVKYETPNKTIDIDPWSTSLGTNYKSWFEDIGIWDSIYQASGDKCADEIKTRNGLLVPRKRPNENNTVIIQPEKNGKSYTYRLTGGTKVIGNIEDKECSYARLNDSSKTIDVHFFRHNYMDSYIVGSSRKMTGFWWDSGKMFYGVNEWLNSSGIKEMGIYDSYYKYLTTYSTQKAVCPAKLFVNESENYWYAASDSISDKQYERTKDELAGNDDKYVVYKLDKEKICRDNKAENEALLSEIEQGVNNLENAIGNVGTDLTSAIAQNFTTVYETLQQQITQLASNINHCSDSAGYKEIEDKLNELSKKMQELRQTLKKNIRSSTLDDAEKEDLLKNVDKAYSDMLKSDNLDISGYNQPMDCSGLFGDPNDPESLAYLIQKVLDYIKIIGPILVVVLSSVDFIKVIWLSDDENMKKAQQKLVKRLAAAILLFLLPLLVSLLFSLLNNSIVDPTCGIQ